MKNPFRPEQAAAYSAEIEESTKKLREFIRSVAADYRNDHNIPLDNEGRLIPASHEDAGSSTEGLRKWHGDVADKTAVKNDWEEENERLEMLVYAIFWKNLKEKFVIVRASRHDGDINKVHTVLLEKGTGALVCAFDEVGDTAGADYDRKQEAIRDRNFRGGASLKHGLRLEKRDDRAVITQGEVRNIPIFYIAIPKDRVDKGVTGFNPSPEQSSEFEKKLFQYFVLAISQQIGGLELYENRLDENLKKRLSDFKRAV